ncbi:GHKL domain-containing protein [Eubacterium sp. 1001713B170207_170306_E7]|uniref:GHKL domain-containing protein n=1 Tax=Eubacterium sp. 1001713B170207_170306_E7 TaxID=2787097 RepID=UPI00189B4DA4|nr:GHKL domain-containing protein [Eubacterium sp. 1001713B170207_170306_E7]
MDKAIAVMESMVSSPLGLIYISILSDGWRFSKKVTRWLVLFFIALLFLADILIVFNVETTQSAKSSISIFNIIACGLFYFLIYRHLGGRMLFNFFSACLFIFISDTLSDSVFYSTAQIHVLIKLFVFLFIALLLYLFFRKPFLEVFRAIRGEWWWLMTIPVSLSFVFAMIIMLPGPLYQHPEMQPQALFMCVAVVCVYVAFYIVFRNMNRRNQIEKSYELLQMQMSFIEKHTATLQKMDEQVRMYRHDMRHYAQLINTCVTNRDWSSIQKVVDSMDTGLNATQNSGQLQIYTGEMIVDGVLSFFTEKLEKEQIDYTILLETPSEKRIDITEFSVMLSNAIENAWNACRAMDTGVQKSIRITGRQQHSQYFLEIDNTCANDVVFDGDGMPAGSKKGHGYGTQSIADFASRYHGFLKFTCADNCFRMRLILPCPKEN